MQSFDKRILELIEVVYEAGCDPTEWSRAADLARSLVPGASFSQLVSAGDADPLPISSGWAPDYLKSYAEYYHRVNPYPALLASVPPGTVTVASENVDPVWQSRQEFFNDWLKPAGNFTGGASVTLIRSATTYTRIVFDIPEAYRVNERLAAQILGRIAPHLKRALDLNASLKQAAAVSALADAQLELLDEAAFVVDQSSIVHRSNSKAEGLLTSQGWIRLKAGRLQLQDSADDALLVSAIRSSTGIFEKVARWVFPLSSSDERGLRRAMVLPLRGKRATLPGAGALAMVLISVPGTRQLAPTDLLRQLYRLTEAEERVVLKIAEGRSLAETADIFRVSRTTVRNQLAAAMRKLGVNRQSELVAFIAGLAPRLTQPR